MHMAKQIKCECGFVADILIAELDAEAKTVLATVIYEPDFTKRAKALAQALEQIKGKP